MASFTTINPATGARLARHRLQSPAEIERALARARRGFLLWRDTPISARGSRLRAAASALRRSASPLAELATREMGKPLVQARAEVEKCAAACEFYAAHAKGYLAEERPLDAPRQGSVVFEPLGPVLAVMPWNFPFWQVVRAAAPALMAGNAFLLKHAPNVTGCALAIAEIWREAGLPTGVFQTLLVETGQVPALIADPRVAAVTLTGSSRAGRSVAEAAGASMKKGVYELGGSDAYLILEDADLAQAAEVCASSRLINSGQSCVCAKRFIVTRKVRREFEERFMARLAARRIGDPMDPSTDVGPLARADLREALHRQVSGSLRAGALLRLGGKPIRGPGFYYAPTLLTSVRKGAPAYAEELFGPVAALITARDEEHAVALANDSAFGLGAAIFTADRRRGRKIALRIEAGCVFVNDFVRSDPSLPFGGIKQSGYGRELGPYGIREFVSAKTLWVS